MEELPLNGACSPQFTSTPTISLLNIVFIEGALKCQVLGIDAYKM